MVGDGKGWGGGGGVKDENRKRANRCFENDWRFLKDVWVRGGGGGGRIFSWLLCCCFCLPTISLGYCCIVHYIDIVLTMR